MSSAEVRPFRRSNRDQLASLVNAHAGAVVPGMSAVLGDDVIGYIEVETGQDTERQPRHGGWADIGNLRVKPGYRRRGVATWLVGQAADWLRLAGVDRLLDYAWLEGPEPGGRDYAGYRAFLAATGFRELTRTRRGWTRTMQNTPAARRPDHGQQ
jgi:GNAT superfamily N-acetyltransferase